MNKVFKYLFFTILALFSLGQLERLQLNEVTTFYIHDVIIVTWVILATINYRQQLFILTKKYFANWLSYACLFWVNIGLTTHSLVSGFSIIPVLYLARTASYLFFALSLPLVIGQKKENYRRWWVISGALIAVFGLIQYWLLPDTRFIHYLGWDDHYFRLISTQFDPNFTGILLVMTFVITQSIWEKQKYLKMFISALLVGSILLTYSRASYLSFFISLIMLIVIRFIKSYKNEVFLPIIIGLFVMLIPFLPRPAGEGVKLERTASITARIDSNQLALNQLAPHEWLIGRGLFVYQEDYLATPKKPFWPNTAHFPDNLFVFLFTSTGLVGLGLSLIVLYKISSYLYLKDIYVFTAFVAILVHSQFNHTLFQPFVWLWLTSQIFTIRNIKT